MVVFFIVIVFNFNLNIRKLYVMYFINNWLYFYLFYKYILNKLFIVCNMWLNFFFFNLMVIVIEEFYEFIVSY